MKVLPVATAKGRNQSGTIAGKVEGRDRGADAERLADHLAVDAAARCSPGRSPSSATGVPQATSTHSMPRRTLPRDSSRVLPCSRVTVAASSSKCSSSSSRNRNIARARVDRRRVAPARERLLRGGDRRVEIRGASTAASGRSSRRSRDCGRRETRRRARGSTGRRRSSEELPTDPLSRGGFYSSQSGQPRKGIRSAGRRVGVAFDARPGPAVGVPEIALELIGLVRVLGEDPAEEHVRPALAGILQEPLAQVHVVAADALGDLPVRADALQEEDARPPRRNRTRDVRLGQADRGLNAGRGRKAGKKRQLRRVGRRCVEARAPGKPHRDISLARIADFDQLLDRRRCRSQTARRSGRPSAVPRRNR